METAIIQKLAALNAEFYEAHGENFADTRPRLPSGVQRVLAQIPAGSRVLEIGCGDGKVGRRLAARGCAYVGVDVSNAMIARAKEFTENWRTGEFSNSQILFFQADVLTPSWSKIIEGQPFDWILAFAVLHHLPGAETRARVVRECAARLAEGGRLVFSNWQFTRSERLRARVRSWEELGLNAEQVEANDYVLSWERKGRRGLRYVHLLDEAEARQLAAQANLRVLEVFSADGVSGNLAEYGVLGA
jgi:SAM-dependent methyltransferase